MAGSRAGGDVDQVGGLENVEPVPHALRHEERLARADFVARLGTDVVGIAIVEDDLDPPGHEIQELVTVGVHLTTVRRRPIHVGDDADGVPVDPHRAVSS